jgi:hypothetical protein
MKDRIEFPMKIKRSIAPDSTGGFDYAIYDQNQFIIAECFEHVGRTKDEFEVAPAESNAKLCAEALNIHKETGMTPGQLADDRQTWMERFERERTEAEGYALNCDQLMKERDELLDALQSISLYANDTLSGRSDGLPDNNWYAEGIRELRNRARAAIAKVKGKT